MQAVELVLVLRLLFEQPFNPRQNTGGLGRIPFIIAIQLSVDVPPDAPDQGALGL